MRLFGSTAETELAVQKRISRKSRLDEEVGTFLALVTKVTKFPM
jgi:hypothetical protein